LADALPSGVSATSIALVKYFRGLLAFPHQVECASSRDVGGERVRRSQESLAIQRQCLFRLSFTHQLLALFNVLGLLLLGGRLCKQRSQRTENDEPRRSNRTDGHFHGIDYKSLHTEQAARSPAQGGLDKVL
jgi:hypothetical protein